MGRKRIDKNQVKKRISIRLKKETLDKIKKDGNLQAVIEKIVEEKYNNKFDKDT